MYFFDCIQRVGVACGEVKRGTVRFVFGTRSNFPPTFLILKLFIRCLLVGVRVEFARSRRVRLSWRLGILWLIVADHDCIYWLYL
jgi:hypothetical protein